MSSKALPLAIASGASLAALGGVAQASQDHASQEPASQDQQIQPSPIPSAPPQSGPIREQQPVAQSGAELQPGYTKACAYRDGPRAGQTIDYSGTAGAVPVQTGQRCADLQGSSGVAVASATSAQPAGPGQRQLGQGRFYRGPDTPNGWNAASNALQFGFTLSCRFIDGPRRGTSADFSGVLGAQPVAVGSPCKDGADSGVGVAPSSADQPQS